MAGTTFDNIIAVISGQTVIAGIARNVIRPCATEDEIVAVAAIDCVIPAARIDAVIVVTAVN